MTLWILTLSLLASDGSWWTYEGAAQEFESQVACEQAISTMKVADDLIKQCRQEDSIPGYPANYNGMRKPERVTYPQAGYVVNPERTQAEMQEVLINK